MTQGENKSCGKLVLAAPSDGVLSTVTVGEAFLVPTRVREDQALAYRLARKKDGSLVLQGLYRWYEGLSGGQEWEEVPIVDLDE